MVFASNRLEELRQELYKVHPLSDAEKEKVTSLIKDIYRVGCKAGHADGRAEYAEEVVPVADAFLRHLRFRGENYNRLAPGSKLPDGYVPEHEHQGDSGPVRRDTRSSAPAWQLPCIPHGERRCIACVGGVF